MAEGQDKARDEFFSEAQELVETLSRSLLAMDEVQGGGTEDPRVVNEAFRAVHTLKSLAGIFGTQAISAVSNRLEDVLDAMRLEKVRLSAELLDVLFQAVELYWRLLAYEKEPEGAAPETSLVLEALQALGVAQSASDSGDELEFDSGLLAVLTEYEEHRLRSSIKQGMNLFRVRVLFSLATIDKELEAIKQKARPVGEVITYLPTGESANADSIELDILLASNLETDALQEALGGEGLAVSLVPRGASPAVESSDGSVASPASADGTSMVPSQETGRPATTLTAVGAHSETASSAVVQSISQTVRVDIRKLDELMNAVGELTILRGTYARIGETVRSEGDRQLGSELYRLNRTFERRLRELQNGILDVRMVPLSQVFDRLTRVVRQISRDVHKEIRLVITGGDTEIDKLLVEKLSDPLLHIVRNAIDHGIESPSQRIAVGKPEAGTIVLNAFQKGIHVVLEVEDDGRGVDTRALVARAVESGRVAEGEAEDLNAKDALNLMFLPGLSTREEAGDYSGRGVGMDVVKTNISKLGGILDLRSEEGIGTQITVTLPITLAIVNALLVKCEGRVFAISLTSVNEAVPLDVAAVKSIDGREVMTLRGRSLPLCDLGAFFDFAEHDVGATARSRFVVVAMAGMRRLGLIVDELLGQQDIVIKALGPSLSGAVGFSGATELENQHVALVLDAAAIIEEVLSGAEHGGFAAGRLHA